jgi:hypothetical protein
MVARKYKKNKGENIAVFGLFPTTKIIYIPNVVCAVKDLNNTTV